MKSPIILCLTLGLSFFAQSIQLQLVAQTPQKSQTDFPIVEKADRQPLLSQVKRVIEALNYLGTPLDPETARQLRALNELDSDQQVTQRVQDLLDPLCLFAVTTQKKGPPKVVLGQAKAKLVEQGWRTFLIKVSNPTFSTGRLMIESPNSKPLPHAPANEVESRWMQLASFEGRPLNPDLSGLGLEYRIVQIYCRDSGSKQGLLEITVSRPEEKGDTIRRWRFDKGTDGWFPINQIKIEAQKGSLAITSSGSDPFMGANVTAKGRPMVLRFWGRAETDGVGQFYWWTRDQPNPDGQRTVNFLVEPNKESLYEIPFHPKGELIGIRLDPLIKKGKFRIDWIDLCSVARSSNWSKLNLDFQSEPATPVTFRILDAYGKPGFASFIIRNGEGQVFPAQSKRLAPDFFFQKQIYREDREIIGLPQGEYEIICSRGPESIPETKKLKVGDQPVEFFYRVKRWIDPALDGWYSGDHHIHAAGCLHYENPTEGVMPKDMIRHIMGEDLKVGCCLTWGPCFDFQKRFFTGETAEQSRYPYLLRYDVEVSGFGSHQSGHLNLLNLREQIYPGGESKDHWPTLGLNTLRWAKSQGAICGPAHSSIGLTRSIGRVPNTEGKDGKHNLPNFEVPAFDGIGANEFIMNVTHQVRGPKGTMVPAVDFISAMNTERVAEWNIWYHVLNCGFRVAVSGETDFPCISGERVGMGRVYAKVDGPLSFAKWVKSVANGRSYVSDGTCHLLEFQAHPVGQKSALTICGIDSSEMNISDATNVKFQCEVAARKNGAPPLELELIVNGYPVVSKQIKSDGKLQTIEFEHPIARSSWVAVRAFPHAHSNPIFVIVDGKPVRASADSARWCLASVEQCRKSKMPTYAEKEKADATKAYDHAAKVFQNILNEFKD